MQNRGRRELQFIRLSYRRAADFGGSVEHLDIVRSGGGKLKQAADEAVIANSHERMTRMPGCLAALTVHQVRGHRQVGARHDHADGLDVGIQIQFCEGGSALDGKERAW